MTKALKRLAAQIAIREGITPLGRGETRPDGYYLGNHATGESRVKRGAVISAKLSKEAAALSNRKR
jgi:hypothetical protein